MLIDAPNAANAAPAVESVADASSGHLRVLQTNARDIHGRVLMAGTRVLAHPLAPTEFMEDTPANRAAFAAADFTWRPETRSDAWFGPPVNDAGFQTQVALARARMGEFLAAIDVNIAEPQHGMRGQPFPALRPPFWFALLPWEPTVSRVEMVSDGDIDLADRLVPALAGPEYVAAPADVVRPPAFLDLLKSVNKMRVYRLHSQTAVVDVLAAFIAPVRMTEPGRANFTEATSTTLDLLATIYNQWRAARGETAPLVFLAVGTPMEWRVEEGHLARASSLAVCSAPGPDGDAARWTVTMPPRQGDRLALRQFLDRLRPQTQQARAAAIRAIVDEHLPLAGKVTPELVERALGYPRSEIIAAFKSMEQHDGYRMEHADGKIWIGKPADSAGAVSGPSRKRRPWHWRLAVGLFLLIAPNVFAAFMNWWALGARVQVSTLVVSAAAAYIWAVLSRRVASRQKIED